MASQDAGGGESGCGGCGCLGMMLVIALSPVMLLLGPVLGLVIGPIAATANFLRNLRPCYEHARALERRHTETSPDAEPAYRSFWFGPAQDTAREALAHSTVAIRELSSVLGWMTSNNPLGDAFAFGAYCAVPTVYSTGTLAVFACAEIVAAGAVLGTLLAVPPYLVVRGFEALYMRLFKIHAICPQDNHVCRPPVFLCKRCGREHRRLIPSRYGVFRRRCVCGYSLPTLMLLGRNARLQGFCPRDGAPLNELVGVVRDVHIAMVGAPGSGKTSFAVQALRRVMGERSDTLRGTLSFAEPEQQSCFEDEVRALREGRKVTKTRENPHLLRARMLLHQSDNRGARTLIYFYDLAGEFFEDQRKLEARGFLKHLDAVILMIDPFAFEEVAQRYSQYNLERDAEPCGGDPRQLLERLVMVLEMTQGMERRQNLPLAAVIVKTDVADLESLLGDAAIAQRLPRGNRRHYLRSMHEACRATLRDTWGLQTYVQRLESAFPRAQYFSCSPLGRPVATGERKDFEPRRVEYPLLWALRAVGIGATSGQETTTAPAHRKLPVVRDATAPAGG